MRGAKLLEYELHRGRTNDSYAEGDRKQDFGKYLSTIITFDLIQILLAKPEDLVRVDFQLSLHTFRGNRATRNGTKHCC